MKRAYRVLVIAMHASWQLPPPPTCDDQLARAGFILVEAAICDEQVARLASLALEVTRRQAVHVGRSSSLGRLNYTVVTGEHLREDARELFECYTDATLLAWVRAITHEPRLAPSPHLRSSININCLCHRGQRYPWHQDAVPYTALLFLTTLPMSAGGHFLIRAATGRVHHIRPRQGQLLFMDGNRCPHAVGPLREDVARLTVPMVFPATLDDRPEGLDDFLYGPAPALDRS